MKPNKNENHFNDLFSSITNIIYHCLQGNYPIKKADVLLHFQIPPKNIGFDFSVNLNQFLKNTKIDSKSKEVLIKTLKEKKCISNVQLLNNYVNFEFDRNILTKSVLDNKREIKKIIKSIYSDFPTIIVLTENSDWKKVGKMFRPFPKSKTNILNSIDIDSAGIKEHGQKIISFYKKTNIASIENEFVISVKKTPTLSETLLQTVNQEPTQFTYFISNLTVVSKQKSYILICDKSYKSLVNKFNNLKNAFSTNSTIINPPTYTYYIDKFINLTKDISCTQTYKSNSETIWTLVKRIALYSNQLSKYGRNLELDRMIKTQQYNLNLLKKAKREEIHTCNTNYKDFLKFAEQLL